MSKRRILVADELGKEGLEVLAQSADVTVKTGMDEDTLRETLPGFHALIIRSATKVTARSLELADDLIVVGRAGIGVDNIDIPAATARGIVVMNTPLTAAVTTAEHAIALMMSLARNIAAADASMKAGRWDKKLYVGTEMAGKTLGVLGLGKIGSIVANRGQGLSMEVIAHDPALEGTSSNGVELVDFDTLLERSDFITLHLPKLPATTGLMGKDAFAKMKPGARLIHAARGGIVNEAALIEALESGHLAGAALDVFESEPLAEDHPLRSLDQVVLTPHLGASTREAKMNVSIDMANQIVACVDKGIVLNGLNTPRIAPDDAPRIAPYLKLTRSLAKLLLEIFPGKLEGLRLTLQGALLRTASDALEAEMIAGALSTRSDLPVTPVNAQKAAADLDVRVHTDPSNIKRDFVNLVRVEAMIAGQRHHITGVTIGSRHGRMVELDDYMLDAIPEGALLVTFHRDRPGVIGEVGRILGRQDENVARVQLGQGESGGTISLGIWNLSGPLGDEALGEIQELDPIDDAYAVSL